jgi:hypothetical protein
VVPFITTLTPNKLSPVAASVTLPFTVMFCANTVLTKRIQNKNNPEIVKFLFMWVI